MFNTALRCSHCQQWLNPKAGAKVEQEQSYWSQIAMEAKKNDGLFDQDAWPQGDDPNAP